MAIKEIATDCFEIDGKARIDRGPPLRRSVANAQNLDDAVTPRHYQLGKPDAEAKEITAGKEFAWLDWRNRDAWVWYVYELDGDGRWVRSGEPATDKETALARAKEIAK